MPSTFGTDHTFDPFRSGPALRGLREKRGLSQTDVAAGAGVSRERISQIERAAEPSDRDIQRYLSAITAIDFARQSGARNIAR